MPTTVRVEVHLTTPQAQPDRAETEAVTKEAMIEMAAEVVDVTTAAI